MIKYIATAFALKGFSCCAPMRHFYRGIGNRIGGNRRSKGTMPSFYIDRIKRTLKLCQQFNLVQDGDRILELGTGWLHWEAISLRLFFDVEAILYDVWDNRQFGGLINYMRQLKRILPELPVTAAQLKKAEKMLDAILETRSFDELYRLLNFSYVVESSGSMRRFSANHFNVVVSAGVLEHVYRETVPLLIKEIHRILKPEGWAVHSIDTSDHLAHYDLSASKKKYLSHPEWKWKMLYQNDVQYINRIQRNEWLTLFRTTGFHLVEEESRNIDINSLKLAKRWSLIDKRDLSCTVLKVTMKK